MTSERTFDFVIEIEGVAKSFPMDRPGSPPVLGSIDLAIRDNEFVVLLGRSGCGKTTLLNIVAGLESATAGEVRVAGRRVTGPGGGKGMVFQQNALFPWLTAAGNVMFAAENRGLQGDLPEDDRDPVSLDGSAESRHDDGDAPRP